MVEYKKYLESNEYKNLIYGDIETIKAMSGNTCKTYSTLSLSFDIETSKVNSNGEIMSFMYIWMVGIGNTCVYGRTWEELDIFLSRFKEDVIDTHQYTRHNNRKHKAKVIFFGFIHNIAFEWTFCKGNMQHNITDVFLKEIRQPLYFDMGGVRWIDSFQITRMSLDKLSKTYTKRKKLSGELDYNIVRSYKTILNDKELAYCENDVLVLTEYHKYYVNTYLQNGIKTFIYTQTGIVRARIKQDFNKQCKITHQDIINMFPDSQLEYQIHMAYLFRGGYVHGRADLYNKILYNIDSFDITSAHPYQIVSKMFPISKFVDTKVSRETFIIKEGYAYIIDATFENIQATTEHSLESLSKAVEKENVLLDNGRIHSAGKLRVLLTEIDYELYRLYYKWDNVIFNNVKIAKKGYLPAYVVKNVLDAYETKETLKLQNMPYMNEKVFLNSIYGSFVTKIYKYQYKYNYDNGSVDKIESDYHKEVKKRVLSMYWGIWTTAYTRYQQLTLMHKLGGVYGDTDSDKTPHNDNNFAIVKDINDKIMQGNAVICKRYHKNYTLVKELGQWDYEGTYSKFKMLGAKRYVYELNNETHITCAGLPKSVKIDDPFTNFRNGMYIPNCKLTTLYHDNEYCANVAGVDMSSKTGVSLIPCDFTLTVANEYVEFVQWILEKVSRETP